MHLRFTRTYQVRGIHCLELDVRAGDTPKAHGHNYQVEVTLTANIKTGEPSPFSLANFDHTVQTLIVKPYDKSRLNQHFSITSGEYLAHQFFLKLKSTSFGPYLTEIAIQETSKNRFTCRAVSQGTKNRMYMSKAITKKTPIAKSAKWNSTKRRIKELFGGGAITFMKQHKT